MNKFKLTILAAAVVSFTGAAQAGSSTVLNKDLLRISADKASGDKVSTVRNNCGGGVEGWDSAIGSIKIKQKGAGSTVKVEIENAVPHTFFTVWVRIKGSNGLNSLGSPLTGGGATPLSPSSELNALNDVSPWNDGGAGSDLVANGFWTDADGDGGYKAHLDFPVVGGAYPFQNMVGSARPGHDGHPDIPTAIANPADAGQSATGFLIRVVSHCQDQKGHGLAPSVGSNPGREAWFQTKG